MCKMSDLLPGWCFVLADPKYRYPPTTVFEKRTPRVPTTPIHFQLEIEPSNALICQGFAKGTPVQLPETLEVRRVVGPQRPSMT